MSKFFFKYLIICIASVILAYQFHESLTQLKLIPKGLAKLIFPEKKTKPIIENISVNDQVETIDANSFELKVKKVD